MARHFFNRVEKKYLKGFLKPPLKAPSQVRTEVKNLMSSSRMGISAAVM